MSARLASTLAIVAAASIAMGCRDVTRFSTDPGDHYEGAIVQGSFVRAGFDETTRVCLQLDAARLQDAPGALTSSDGRFQATPLRPIPQLWHDPLSTMTFGDGRVQNALYVVTPTTDAGAAADVMIVLSLMQSGGVELRMLRGAPSNDGGDEGASLFGVFSLKRTRGPCSF